MPPGAASHQDEDRLLQGWKAQRDVSERRVRLPRLWIPTAAGPELSKRGTVLQLHTRGQFLCTESHAGDDPGLEHPATDTAVAGRHRPQAQPAELLRNVGDGRGQAASGRWLTASMPLMNFTPVISFGNWLW